MSRLREHLFQRQQGICHYCGCAMTLREFSMQEHPLRATDATVEHLVPRVLGGRDTRDNLVAACHSCNRIGARIDKWCVETFGGRRTPRQRRV